MRATIMEVDKKRFNKNVKNISEYAKGKMIMPIIKANAYGTYINKDLDLINQFDIVAVAVVEEAKELRELGYKKEIFVLNQPYYDDIDNILKYDITIGISELEFIKTIINLNKKIKVHIELETGMNRTGVKISNLDEMLNLVKNSNLIVEGVYTHLSSADQDKEYTLFQLNNFKNGVKKVKEVFKNIKYVHSSASNGLLNYNDEISNLVRPGIIMYGYESFKGVNKLIDIKPICRLKTHIIYIKEINENESVSYSRKFISKQKMKIATIPIGYADGLRRELTNKGFVVVKGKKVPIIGSVCMDSCMIDVTDIDVKVGDEVYIWDNDIIKLEDISELCNTINYEIMSTISYRVPRVDKYFD